MREVLVCRWLCGGWVVTRKREVKEDGFWRVKILKGLKWLEEEELALKKFIK